MVKTNALEGNRRIRVAKNNNNNKNVLQFKRENEIKTEKRETIQMQCRLSHAAGQADKQTDGRDD